MRALVTDADLVKLAHWLEARRRWPSDETGVEALRRTVDDAEVVRSEDVPPDVVTLHSRVRVVDLEHGAEEVYTLVGAQGALGANTVSASSPVGAALLGRRAGDEVAYRDPGGGRRLRIREVVYQPERRP